jgi:hypothetical protein
VEHWHLAAPIRCHACAQDLGSYPLRVRWSAPPPPACLQDRIFVDVTGCPGFAINLPGFSLAINLG